MKTWTQFLESKSKKKKKGLKFTLTIGGEPVIVGQQKKESTDRATESSKTLRR